MMAVRRALGDLLQLIERLAGADGGDVVGVLLRVADVGQISGRSNFQGVGPLIEYVGRMIAEPCVPVNSFATFLSVPFCCRHMAVQNTPSAYSYDGKVIVDLSELGAVRTWRPPVAMTRTGCPATPS